MESSENGLGRARGRSRGLARGIDPTDNSTESASTLGRGRGPQFMGTTSSNISPSNDNSDPTAGRGLRRGMERGRASLNVCLGDPLGDLDERFKKAKIDFHMPNEKEVIAPSRMFHSEVIHDQHQTRDANVIVENKHASDKCNKITLQTNVLFLQNRPNWTLYSYSVDFKPAQDSKMMKKIVLKQHTEDFFGGSWNKVVFDGTKLWTRERINDGESVIKAASTLKEGGVVKFRMKYIKEHDINDPISLQVYNLHFKRYQELCEMKEINRDFFSPHLAAAVTSKGHKFQVWPGIIARINRFEKVVGTGADKAYEDRPALLLDTKSKIVRQESCYETIKTLTKQCKAQSKDVKVEIKRNLVGSTVVTSYGKQENYRVEDVIWDLNPASTFDKRGTDTSYMQYYKDQYNITIKDKKQPLFSCKAKKRRPGEKNNSIYLIPELCSPTGLTDAMRMDFTIMRELAGSTRKSPNERFSKYKEIQDLFMHNEGVSKMMTEWGIRFEKSGFAKAEGIRLKNQDITMTKKGSKSVIRGSDKADWDRDLKSSNLLISPPNLKKWVFLGNKKSEKLATQFSGELEKSCHQLGWKIAKCSKLQLVASDRDMPNTAQDFIDKKADFMVCFVQRENKSVYDSIKKKALQAGIPTQFVKERTVGKNMGSVALKVALQMACKCGGEPWSVAMPKTIQKAPVMYIGIDVYHDTVKKADSVYALVASINPDVTRWFSTHTILGQTEEVGNAVRTMIIEAMEAFKHNNGGNYPGKVYVYRDGVGDTDLYRVKAVEVDMVVKAFEDLQAKAKMEQPIGLTFSIVKKRIDHKFMSIGKQGCENPPAGTVCDTVLRRLARGFL
jgi:aubergine-like protein